MGVQPDEIFGDRFRFFNGDGPNHRDDDNDEDVPPSPPRTTRLDRIVNLDGSKGGAI